jgi:hypothetical protein
MTRACDTMRQSLEAVLLVMSQAITAMRNLGQHELANELTALKESWRSTSSRGLRAVSPRGRLVVPPIVPEGYSVPRVRAPQHVPALRVVEVEPSYHDQLASMSCEAERQARAIRKLLEQCRREREVPDAG